MEKQCDIIIIETNTEDGGIVMTVREINFTFGPKDVLEGLQEKYPKRNLVLFRSVTDRNRYMLFDYSGQENIFTAGLSYTLVRKIEFEENWDGFFEFRYLTLDNDEQKVFTAIMDKWEKKDRRPFGLNEVVVLRSENKNFEHVMINIWEDEADFLDWSNTQDNELKNFGHQGNKGALVTEYERIK